MTFFLRPLLPPFFQKVGGLPAVFLFLVPTLSPEMAFRTTCIWTLNGALFPLFCLESVAHILLRSEYALCAPHFSPHDPALPYLSFFSVQEGSYCHQARWIPGASSRFGHAQPHLLFPIFLGGPLRFLQPVAGWAHGGLLSPACYLLFSTLTRS